MNALIITSVLFVGVVLGLVISRRRAEPALSELAELKLRYRRLHGWSEWYGCYDLESFDGGRTWYAMWTLPDGRRVVRGQAEQVHPGILSEPGSVVEAMEPVGDKVAQCSDLTVKDEISAAFEALEKQELQRSRRVSAQEVAKQKLCGRFLLREIVGFIEQVRK